MTNLKRNLIFLFVIGIPTIWVSIYFYQRNASDIYIDAKAAFESVLKEELQKKNEELDIYRISSTATGSDTIKLKVFAKDESGTKEYEYSADKNRMNISRDFGERGLHSFLFEKNLISSDTLSIHWSEYLRKTGISAKTGICIRILDENKKSHVISGNDDNWETVIPSKAMFTCLAGVWCEVEVKGYVLPNWWTVFDYNCIPFVVIVICFFTILFSYYFISKILNRPPKIRVHEKIVTREMPKEVVKEVEVIKEVKTFSEMPTHIYLVRPGLKFDFQKQVLLKDNSENISLYPQACLLLQSFLNAPDFTLTDDEILNLLWPDNSGGANRLGVAIRRLRDSLDKVDPPISIQRIKPDKYKLNV